MPWCAVYTSVVWTIFATTVSACIYPPGQHRDKNCSGTPRSASARARRPRRTCSSSETGERTHRLGTRRRLSPTIVKGCEGLRDAPRNAFKVARLRHPASRPAATSIHVGRNAHAVGSGSFYIGRYRYSVRGARDMLKFSKSKGSPSLSSSSPRWNSLRTRTGLGHPVVGRPSGSFCHALLRHCCRRHRHCRRSGHVIIFPVRSFPARRPPRAYPVGLGRERLMPRA